MPALDKTGPQGQGPMTGRGLGPCGGGKRMGFGRCRGYGRGLGRYFGWNAPQTKEEKLDDVQAYKNRNAGVIKYLSCINFTNNHF